MSIVQVTLFTYFSERRSFEARAVLFDKSFYVRAGLGFRLGAIQTNLSFGVPVAPGLGSSIRQKILCACRLGFQTRCGSFKSFFWRAGH